MTYRTIDEMNCTPWQTRVDGKEYAMCDLEVWSDKGFTPVRHIVRHYTDKRMFRVSTHTGIVDVTEDHSLLKPNGEKISAKDVKIGENLLHCDLPERLFPVPTKIDTDYAWALGLFYADGSCGSYICPNGYKFSWAINNQDKALLQRAASALNNAHPTLEFCILDTMKSSVVYKLVPKCQDLRQQGKISGLVRSHGEWFYDERRYKKVPDFILNASYEIQLAFATGYYHRDGLHEIGTKQSLQFANKGKIGSAGLYHLFSNLGYTVVLNAMRNKPNCFFFNCYSRGDPTRLHGLEEKKNVRLTTDGRKVKKYELHTIKSVQELPKTEQYVYDIETGSHHFHAAPGRMIVKNTDSCFANFPTCSLAEAISLSHKAAKLLTDSVFNRKPIEMEYEKIYYPLYIQKKKNYIGLKYEMDDARWKVDYKGIAIKRRNYCDFVKEVFWNVIYPALGVEPYITSEGKKDIRKVDWDFHKRPEKALEALEKSLMKLAHNVIPLDNFTISASLKSDYKGPTCTVCDGRGTIFYCREHAKEKDCSKCRCSECGGRGVIVNLPHIQLAKRMKERDEGSAPISGQRFGYVIVNDPTRRSELWARSEDPKFAKQNELLPDYLFYLDQQIRKPLTKFLSLLDRAKETEAVFSTIQTVIFDQLRKRRKDLERSVRKDYFNPKGKRLAPIEPLKAPKKPVAKKKKHEEVIKQCDNISNFFQMG